MATITGGEISALISYLALLDSAGHQGVHLTVAPDADKGAFALSTADNRAKAFPADAIAYGKRLGFTYVEFDKSVSADDPANFTHFAW